MRTAKENREEILRNSLTIPLTDAEKQKIEQTAKDKGLTMSSYVRMVVREAMKGE